ncbi:glycosyltransferase [Aequorivita sp. KMM 9714]|uniref:glycosyltransferase n=1 Tax=Aequorivita sp. KMM 9714 TaxID=2707173 RepID=UPI0013EB5EC0|nr:glycosyltransferase [Aequorivita sp. KMM 9714]NGX84735.1 glycosyltransferase [Aequorivita sp. KMM 9714]
MGQKIKLLFVIESLTLAGSEKSLIALLTNLDSELYEIDLQLFRYGGELEGFLPNYVNVLPVLPYNDFVSRPFIQNFKSLNFKFIKAKLTYSLGLRKRTRNHSEIAKLYWESVQNTFSIQSKKYDVAIAFAQGVPTFYVMDKVKATKKVTWVNANMQFTKNNIEFQRLYYSKYDYIVAISEGTKDHMINYFPDLKSNFIVISNIIDSKSIFQMARLYKPEFYHNKFNILTVGRLDEGMKGMDITIETCKVLKEHGVNFHWYIIGEGAFKSEMESFIKNNELQNDVSLLGSTDNPYPFFKVADLYVQTSRHEGYGRTIAEARMLNLPIVTTNFDTVGLQIKHKKNGIITAMNPESVADGIIDIMNDKKLYNTIQDNLKKEPKENTETIKRFDAMINNLISNN